MSFSGDVKKEIISKPPVKDCCIFAACYGIACFGKYFDTKGLILHTEKVFIAQYAKQMYENIGIHGKIYVKGSENKRLYEYAIKEQNDIDKMLAMFGHSGDETTLHINTENLVCDECFAHFLASAFLCCGTITTPESDYNLEFSSSRLNLIKDFKKLLLEKEFEMKYIMRKSNYILYVKASTQIEDLLTTMGAYMASMELMNFKIYRDFRNKANRMANCETANISKVVQANQTTISAIEYLISQNALKALSQPLQQAANARLQNPDLSLSDLAIQLTPAISKSGLSHRLKKIEQIAQNLKDKTKGAANA